MKYINIAAGHWNIKYNCDKTLMGSTGAPLESGTNVAVAMRLEKILQDKGFKTYLSDANYNCKPEAGTTDFDLYISCHCDSNYAGNEGGGFVDYPAPDLDSNNAESKRIKEAIESEYFKESGIRNVPSRSNVNTKRYYMWKALSPKTPCVILEMGESIDPHDRVLLNDTERIAQAIAKGINKAFPGVVTPPTPEPPSDPCANLRDEFSRVSASLLNAELDRDKALNSQKTLLTENADLKRKLIDIQKILNG